MRTCEKNKQIIHWKKYIGIQEKVEDKEYTGEFVKTFKSPVALRVNIISGKSIEEALKPYGLYLNHKKVIYMSKQQYISLGITNSDIFVIQSMDFYPNTANYRISKVYDSLNEVLIGLDEE